MHAIIHIIIINYVKNTPTQHTLWDSDSSAINASLRNKLQEDNNITMVTNKFHNIYDNSNDISPGKAELD